MTVSGVAEPLAVRAVGYNAAVHIVELCADIRVEQEVQPLAVRLERGGQRRVRVDYQNFNRFVFARYLEISERVPDKLRLEYTRFAVTDKAVAHYL